MEPSKNQGKIAFSAFRGFGFLAHFSVFSFLVLFAAHKSSSKIFPLLRGGLKTGENKGCFCLFRGCFVLVVVFFHVVPLCSCFSRCTFFVAKVWFVFDVLHFPFDFLLFSVMFFFGEGVIHLFTLITSMVLHQWPKTWWNHRKPQYLKCLFLMFCFGACTLTLSPGPNNNRNPKPSTLQIVFVYFIMLLILCWNANFYSVFRTSTKFAPKIGP